MNRKKAICMYIVLLLVYFSSFNAHDFPKEVVLDDRKLLEHLRGWKANTVQARPYISCSTKEIP